MRNITVIEHITLDGVIQSPGDKAEDQSNGFQYGGWINKYSDEVLGAEIRNIMNQKIDLLIGRRTYDIWSLYWPFHNEVWPNVNLAEKYVVTKNLNISNWQHTTIVKGNIYDEITKLKERKGREIHVWGSSLLVQTLLKQKLIDTIKLFVYPVTLGEGKKLFNEGTIIEEYSLSKCICTKMGVLFVEYNRQDNKLGINPIFA